MKGEISSSGESNATVHIKRVMRNDTKKHSTQAIYRADKNISFGTINQGSEVVEVEHKTYPDRVGTSVEYDFKGVFYNNGLSSGQSHIVENVHFMGHYTDADTFFYYHNNGQESFILMDIIKQDYVSNIGWITGALADENTTVPFDPDIRLDSLIITGSTPINITYTSGLYNGSNWIGPKELTP